MANNNPASPWRKDFRVMTRNENIAPRDFVLEIDGKEVPLEQYQAEQKKRAFAMRNLRRAK